MLNLTLGDDESNYSSVILEPDADHGYVLLDQLNPADGTSLLRVGTKVAVSTLLNGLQLTFTSLVTELPTGENSPGIYIGVPEHVHYVQRRSEHRVPVPMNRSISVSIIPNHDRRIEAVVRDLSPGGFSAQLHAPLPEPVEALNSPLKFSLNLGAGRSVEGEMEICYVEIQKFGKLQTIGTRILATSPQHQRVIDRCVAEIDRQQSRLA